jgi:transcriptional accessory protein Tex/SPT6
MSACSKSKSDRREKVTKSLRDRGQKLDTQWSDLESDIDEFRSLTAKENRKRIQAIIRNQTQLVDELKEGIKMSGDATDAEELSEHVDNMERLLDKITNGQKEGSDPFAEFKATNIEDTLIAGEVEKLRSTREQVIDEARRRCSRLQSGITLFVFFPP